MTLDLQPPDDMAQSNGLVVRFSTGGAGRTWSYFGTKTSHATVNFRYW